MCLVGNDWREQNFLHNMHRREMKVNPKLVSMEHENKTVVNFRLLDKLDPSSNCLLTRVLIKRVILWTVLWSFFLSCWVREESNECWYCCKLGCLEGEGTERYRSSLSFQRSLAESESQGWEVTSGDHRVLLACWSMYSTVGCTGRCPDVPWYLLRKRLLPVFEI